jgi:hypothetical protein
MQEPSTQPYRKPGRRGRRQKWLAVIGVLIVSLLIAGTIQAFPQPFSKSTTPTAPIQTTPTLTITPSGLLTPHDTQVIYYLANQISEAGVPIRVVVQEVPQPPIDVGADASNRATFYPVESKKGAQDGLLMLVEIPSNDHTKTKVAFYTGKNFFPNGGLTEESLTAINFDRIEPRIAQNTIGPAIIDGLNWIAWTNQFESSPRLVPSTWQHRIGQAIDLAIAPLLALYALALIVVGNRARAMTRRLAARPRATENGLDIPADSVHLGALARGQVDDPVMVGVLLQLVAQGAIVVNGKGRKATGVQLLDRGRCQTETQWEIYDLLGQVADKETGWVSAATLRQLPDLWAPLRRKVAAHFASIGLFTPLAQPARRRARWWCAIGVVIAFVVLAVSTASMARWGILAGVGLVIVASFMWWWSGYQSRDTDAARSAVHSPDRYRPRNESEAVELSIFRWVVTLDLSPTHLLFGSGPALSQAEERIRAAATQLNTTVLGCYAG